MGWFFVGVFLMAEIFAGEGGDDGKYVGRPTQNLRDKIDYRKYRNYRLIIFA